MKEVIFNTRVLVIVLLVLCQLDLVLTTLELHLGLIYEANPFMRIFVEQGVRRFIAVKSAISICCCAVFYVAAHKPFCRWALELLLTIYLATLVLHCVGLITL